MFFKELETNRLILKNIAYEDRDFIYRQFSNPIVNKYLFDAEPLVDVKGADEIIEFYLQPEPRAQHRWILITKADGIKIGSCGFHSWNPSEGKCDIGYGLYPDFWGKGYMQEALRALLSFAIMEMGIKQISACIAFDNVKSMELVEKLGFRFFGDTETIRFQGKEYPHRLYRLDCIHHGK